MFIKQKFRFVVLVAVFCSCAWAQTDRKDKPEVFDSSKDIKIVDNGYVDESEDNVSWEVQFIDNSSKAKPRYVAIVDVRYHNNVDTVFWRYPDSLKKAGLELSNRQMEYLQKVWQYRKNGKKMDFSIKRIVGSKESNYTFKDGTYNNAFFVYPAASRADAQAMARVLIKLFDQKGMDNLAETRKEIAKFEADVKRYQMDLSEKKAKLKKALANNPEDLSDYYNSANAAEWLKIVSMTDIELQSINARLEIIAVKKKEYEKRNHIAIVDMLEHKELELQIEAIGLKAKREKVLSEYQIFITNQQDKDAIKNYPKNIESLENGITQWQRNAFSRQRWIDDGSMGYCPASKFIVEPICICPVN
ncbi:MAG: hypothetical protein JEZ07_03580 [Phycisphaerae bacterium]|nr:hypothetical protein [Phycisphaerae bacterium]